MGLSYEFDLKSKEKGYQLSLGIALPSVGEPGIGPYIFPGVAIGKRYLKNKQSYIYTDFQIVGMASGLWTGIGYGTAKICLLYTSPSPRDRG